MSRLMPLLLACALGLAAASPLSAASASERDQQALAVKQLVQLGMRLPAQDQFDAFKAAGYADEGQWIEKVLREAFLLRFSAELSAADAPPPAAPGGAAAPGDAAQRAPDPRFEQELTALTAELDAAAKGGTLPAFARTLRGGGNQLQRMANQLGALINPDLPRPPVAYAPEKRRMATALAEALAKAVAEDFAHALEQVTAHQADEKRMWTLNGRNPEFRKLLIAACDRRIAALSSAYLGVAVLREVALRGKDFGIAPAQEQAQAFLKAFLDQHAATLGQWDFEYGDFTPFVRSYANMLLGEAVRLMVTGANEAEVESGLQAVIDFDTRPLAQDQPALLEAYHLKLGAWCDLLRWRLELGDARALAKGLDAWSGFLDRTRSDALLRLPGQPRLAAGIGQLHLLAARLFLAKGDEATARTLLGQLTAQHPPNPLGENARRWLAGLGQAASGGGWARAPLASDPGTALTLARSYLAEAAATADPARQRADYLDAALTLRNAVLALGRAPDEAIVDFGPATYDLYASTLNRLGMLQHAAIVSLEGARTYADYLEARRQAMRPNPWIKDGTGNQWRDDILTPRTLGLDASSYAERLARIDRGSERIADDAIAQLNRISPADFIPQRQLTVISIALDSGDFQGALSRTQELIKESPGDDLVGYQLLIAIRQRWLAQLARDGGDPETRRRIRADASRDVAMILAALAAEEAKAPSAERRRLIDSTRTSSLLAELDLMLGDGSDVEVMERVARWMAEAPPGDPVAAARALKLACHAADHHAKASAGDTGRDAAALAADWKLYDGLYRCLQDMLPRLRNRSADGDLRTGCLYLAGVMAGVARQAAALGAGAALSSMRADAQRAFADLYEPWIDDRTPAANLLYCADMLWAVAARERAARLYLAYLAVLGRDQELQSFLTQPKPLLDTYGAAVLVRAEFRRPWDEIVDLAYDPPDWLKLYDADAPAGKLPPGVHADYHRALAAIAAFRATALAAQKPVMAGAQVTAVENALGGLERLLGALAGNLAAHRRLALFYCGTGRFDLALEQLRFCYAFDSRDPEAQSGIIAATRQKMLAGAASRAEISDARALAARLREGYRGGSKLGYWEAEIQVMEFSLGLGDTAAVNDTLAFMQRNRSDLSRDLVAPRRDGDDQRVRRAMDAQAVELARRFLALYARDGVGVKPGFRIDALDAGATAITIFTEVDAPAFAARTIAGKTDGDALVIVPATDPQP